jgi:quercetin dioxygenase-like cupin family protein
VKSGKEELPKQVDDTEKTIRESVMGDMNVGYETFKKEVDLQPILRGLPHDNCQSRHWGYVLKGGFEVQYGDHKETCKAGDVYYMMPGHVARIFAGTELIEFSPREEEEKMRDAIRKNMSK